MTRVDKITKDAGANALVIKRVVFTHALNWSGFVGGKEAVYVCLQFNNLMPVTSCVLACVCRKKTVLM